MTLALYTFSSLIESLLNPAQTIEEIDAHRQKEVLALVPYLDAALRRDVSSVAAALVAELEEELNQDLENIEVAKAGGQILKGMHVLAAGDGAKKGVVIHYDAGDHEPYKVRWGDGEQWLKPADIVLDEAAAEEAVKERHKEKVKELEELQAQILSEFDALSDDLATTEKTSWYTETPVVDGTHGAGRCGGVRRAPADAGCPCAGSTRTPTTSRPFAMSSTSSTLGSRGSSRCSCFALALYSCARHLHRG